jgi:hypothetical protein
MRFLKLLALVGVVVGGCLSAGAPVSAAPVGSALQAATAATNAPAEYMQYRRYRPYYTPRRAYRRGYYRPRYYRPRVVCRIRYTRWGPRRVCFRRW